MGDVDAGNTQTLLQSPDLDPHLNPQLDIKVEERLISASAKTFQSLAQRLIRFRTRGYSTIPYMYLLNE